MTSEAYVWIYLPGDVHPTLCGKFVCDMTAADKPVGKFVYGRSYLGNQDAIAIDPIALPLTPKEYSVTSLNGVFGALNDALPDDLGRYVIDRTKGKQAFPVGYMLNTLNDAIGNLAFSKAPGIAPEADGVIGYDMVELVREILLDIEQDEPIPIELEGRLRPNSAVGGARSKLTIEHDGALWLAKFPSKSDGNFEYAKVEAAMLDLAGRCSINAASATVVCNDVLLVKRFDRAWVSGESSGWRRHAFLSARTVFHSDPATPSFVCSNSYSRLAKELTRYSADPAADQKQLFRRMVFNAFISNTDDHDRNHGLLADALLGSYRLSPAYDLVPSIHRTRRRHHSLMLGNDDFLATRENLVADCRSFGLSFKEATEIIEATSAIVDTHWRSCLQAQGLSAEAVERLSPCFAGVPNSESDLEVDRIKSTVEQNASIAVAPVSIEGHNKWSICQERSAQVNDGYIRWVEDPTTAYVVDIQAGPATRGAGLLQWLKDTVNKELYAVGVVDDAVGFLDKMEERDLVKGQSDENYLEYFGLVSGRKPTPSPDGYMQRINALPGLKDAAGARHVLWQTATAAIRDAGGNVRNVDWESVEKKTILASIAVYGHSPEVVQVALERCSPWSVSPERQKDLKAHIQKVAPRLQAPSCEMGDDIDAPQSARVDF